MRTLPPPPAPAPHGVAVEAVHHPSEADVRVVGELIARAERADGHRPVGEHALVELQEGPKTFPHAAFLARVGGQPAGYAHLSERQTRHGWRLELFADPEHRGRGVGTALAAAVLGHVAAHGGGRIHAWAYRPGPAHRRLADRFGMRPVRTILRMERELPGPDAPTPAAWRLRTFRTEDADAWLALHNEAFAGHPDAAGWRPADLAWHLEEPWFDPGGLLLAEDGEGLAGYCWMKPDGGHAWLYFLGVHPRARGSGLGRALAARGLEWAAGRGARSVALYVDEDNLPALHVYEGLGFTIDHADVCYEVDVEGTHARTSP